MKLPTLPLLHTASGLPSPKPPRHPKRDKNPTSKGLDRQKRQRDARARRKTLLREVSCGALTLSATTGKSATSAWFVKYAGFSVWDCAAPECACCWMRGGLRLFWIGVRGEA
ncbi:hypothetical protein BDV25DRAFT_138982 [Aspergillus avenaceus]|uniref:Uncharacterized protein n=1 Tax=Aspergillus avenaceus TaxID=36643 RepID=A0A5N6TY94_ASPAV|nr:hypothetical protein BDV25DRAFT_138982 [Aspergillus avenaceus]